MHHRPAHQSARRLTTSLAAALALFALPALTGCEGMALRDAQLQDSPEAYETFLQQYPASAEAEGLRKRIDDLRWLRARDEASTDGFEQYLTLHPDGAHADEARSAQDTLAWDLAREAGTAASLQGYLDAHPAGQHIKDARVAYEELTFVPNIGIGDVTVEPVNLAGDQKAEPDGWAILSTVINNGDRTVSVVELRVQLLDANNKSLKEETWWAVAPDLGGFPTPPSMKPPLPPGYSRDFRFTTGDIPAGWAKKASLQVAKIQFRER